MSWKWDNVESELRRIGTPLPPAPDPPPDPAPKPKRTMASAKAERICIRLRDLEDELRYHAGAPLGHRDNHRTAARIEGAIEALAWVLGMNTRLDEWMREDFGDLILQRDTEALDTGYELEPDHLYIEHKERPARDLEELPAAVLGRRDSAYWQRLRVARDAQRSHPTLRPEGEYRDGFNHEAYRGPDTGGGRRVDCTGKPFPSRSNNTSEDGRRR